MPAQSKIDMLEKISQSLEANKGMFVIDYRGLSVKEAQELRRSLREANSEMKVYKNNIVKIALEKAGLPAIDDVLVGTCYRTVFGRTRNPVNTASGWQRSRTVSLYLHILACRMQPVDKRCGKLQHRFAACYDYMRSRIFCHLLHDIFFRHLLETVMQSVAERTFKVATRETYKHSRRTGMKTLALQRIKYLIHTHRRSPHP